MMFQDIGVSQVSMYQEYWKFPFQFAPHLHMTFTHSKTKACFFLLEISASTWIFGGEIVKVVFLFCGCCYCCCCFWIIGGVQPVVDAVFCCCCFFGGKIVEVVLLLAPWLLSVHSYPIGISKSTQLLKLTPPAKKLKFCLEK